jgi:tetratricopeptide (TPR) repeat protein
MNMSDVEPHFYLEPTLRVVEQAANIGNQARWLSDQGDYAGAERLQLRALHLKLSVVDEHDTVIAITRNALGELYLKMGRLADAEEQLKKAVSVRLGAGPAFDAAVSIENLGRVYEAKGDFAEARGVRLSHPENIMVCGNYNVGAFSVQGL